jgi:CTP:molybdopterin cytidylyltransferase MocA
MGRQWSAAGQHGRRHPPVTVAGLVLAAGEGRRLGRPKALLEVDGERLVDRAVRVLQEAGCRPVYVVAGAVPLLDVTSSAAAPVTVLDNPDWPTGMGSSVRAGLAAVKEDAVVLMVVDTPGIGPEVVGRLIEAHASGGTAVVAAYGGAARNPVLLDRQHFADVSALAVGDVGARAFLAAHPDVVTLVECADVADPADVDTAADARRRGLT